MYIWSWKTIIFQKFNLVSSPLSSIYWLKSEIHWHFVFPELFQFYCEGWQNSIWNNSFYKEKKIYCLKSTVFWDLMPCSLEEMYQHFGRKHYLHLHSQSLIKSSSNFLNYSCVPESRANMQLLNISIFQRKCMVSHLTRQYSSQSLLRKPQVYYN
jgi:hypothetical protein